MKKLSISLLAIGLTSLGLAQDSYPKWATNYLGVGPLNTNNAYLNTVQDKLTPNQVKFLENLVSTWDVTGTEAFEGNKDRPFKVGFRSGTGYIVASYDGEGKIISTDERFKNIALPNQVSRSIAVEYPKWSILKSDYSLVYVQGKEPRKKYRVLIKRDNLKKRLRIDQSGRIS